MPPTSLRLHRSIWVLSCFFALLAPTWAAGAQGPGRTPMNQPSLLLEGAFTGNVGVEARGAPAGGMAVAQYGARLSVPLPAVDQRWFPSIGVRYRQHDLDRDPGTPVPDTLRSLSLSLNARGSLSPDWSLFGSISPGYGNAGGGFTERGFGVGVMALATRKFSADVSAGFGLRYDSLARGSTRLLPIATFDWSPAPGWRAFLGFPRTGVSWTISPEVSAEFVAEMDFGSYAVADDPLPAGRNKPALNRSRLEYQAVRVGPALTWQMAPAWRVRLGAGIVPVLEAEYESRDYRLRSDGTAGFASLELDWKF
ncbi:MAG: hypothetical protein HZC55_00545 [Verrucomicrobia bacterium]|nr:hypothetical protein [Verrucomicrobiota bacterium]